MKPVFINGIGLLSAACGEVTEDGSLDLSGFGGLRKLRRSSHYSKLAVAAAELAMEQSAVSELEADRVGTIFVTGYGDMDSNLKFVLSVQQDNPSLCSPMVFSRTVPNSCVGQVCMQKGFRGASTILTGGDPLEYSGILLHTQKADGVLCGAVEPYSSEVAKSIGLRQILREDNIKEGAAALWLEREPKAHSYAKMTAFASRTLGGCPYLQSLEEKTSGERIHGVLTEVTKGEFGDVDVIYGTANGSYFDAYEQSILKELFGGNIPLKREKEITGETLGAAYLLNVAQAALDIKKTQDKDGKEPGITTALVTGVDMSGNYLCVKLERCV